MKLGLDFFLQYAMKCGDYCKENAVIKKCGDAVTFQRLCN